MQSMKRLWIDSVDKGFSMPIFHLEISKRNNYNPQWESLCVRAYSVLFPTFPYSSIFLLC